MKWTDKQIETYLKNESRVLRSRDGRKFPLTLMKTYWITFDAAGVDDVYTETDLVAWAEERVEKEVLSFAEAMRGILRQIDHDFRRHMSV